MRLTNQKPKLYCLNDQVMNSLSSLHARMDNFETKLQIVSDDAALIRDEVRLACVFVPDRGALFLHTCVLLCAFTAELEEQHPTPSHKGFRV